MENELELWAESIVSGRTFEPLVNVRLGKENIGQFTPEGARQYAGQLLEAAEAAEGDAFVFHWLTKDVLETFDEKSENWKQIMEDFKAFRETRRTKE